MKNQVYRSKNKSREYQLRDDDRDERRAQRIMRAQSFALRVRHDGSVVTARGRVVGHIDD